ncbi:SAM-dependent methyltransferase [Blastococcus sp. KM273128]|uniref:hypothetical protein n=1 Tax=Blastococcus sp. KM273128 TaxID=2570314 RepID=UPI001F2A5343|nr:hypothetical protein [Blastococcus sp. KM273128]MCF6743550.1 SAM-dependent methyltransferase [Blastococcus sp. KM273128]
MTDVLFDLPSTKPVRPAAQVPVSSALEADFPAVAVSRVAEAESWRKEVHRPATHTHKWWAQRLGSVFRSLIAAAVTETADAAEALVHGDGDLSGLVVFDPFAGSGTTLFEAAKLGASPVGMDINPVATLVQRQSIQRWDLSELERGFKLIEADCREEIDRLHRSQSGETVLYYFWVATADCPECNDPVRLFSKQVFAQHAYARKYPRAQAVCPECLAVVATTYDFDAETCPNGHTFSNVGAVTGAKMTCRQGHQSTIIKALGGHAPKRELYAKLVVSPKGVKRYEAVDDFDRTLAAEASQLLKERAADLVQPKGELDQGYNTRQAMSWGYRRWLDFFNDRQLYCLGLLAASIRRLDIGAAEREALATLFSGTLEFNNLFCSFKGEGTGAVRHMFSHHVLKPERMALEAHPWGTPWSSGSFSTLYKSRLLRAHEHKAKPTDLVLDGDKVERRGQLSAAADLSLVETWPAPGLAPHQALIRAQDSSRSGLPDASVDLVITDPPYMDNVHYSELADFFHAWLREIKPFPGYPSDYGTTRIEGEVQSATAEGFGRAIAAVWRECRRVSKDSGLLAFTFHQARVEGWVALMHSLAEAGWRVTAIQPVTGEMSTSITKAGVKEPSSLDSVVVCRPCESNHLPAHDKAVAVAAAQVRLKRLIEGGVRVGAADIRSVTRGSILAALTDPANTTASEALVEEADKTADRLISTLLG